MKYKNLFIFVIFFIILLLALLILLTQKSSSKPASTGIAHEVTLKEEGFSPEEITINKGDTVKFKSDLNELFWPASDLHPTHGIYPEFDPQEPVEASASWEFIFTKPGTWKYHDHLSPFFRGKIFVK